MPTASYGARFICPDDGKSMVRVYVYACTRVCLFVYVYSSATCDWNQLAASIALGLGHFLRDHKELG